MGRLTGTARCADNCHIEPAVVLRVERTPLAYASMCVAGRACARRLWLAGAWRVLFCAQSALAGNARIRAVVESPGSGAGGRLARIARAVVHRRVAVVGIAGTGRNRAASERRLGRPPPRSINARAPRPARRRSAASPPASTPGAPSGTRRVPPCRNAHRSTGSTARTNHPGR